MDSKLQASLDAVRQAGARAGTAAKTGSEPSRALKTVLDFPFRIDLGDETRARVGALFESVKATPAEGDWPSLYREALAVCQLAAGEIDARAGRLQRDSITIAEESERANRTAGSGHSRTEEARRDAHRAAQRVAKDWTERTRRQLEHVNYECVSTATTTLEREGVQMHPPPGLLPPATEQSLTLSARPDWWHRYASYVQQSCDRWTQVTSHGLESGLREALSASMQASGAGVPLSEPGSARAAPDTDMLLGGRPPPQQVVEVPGLLATAFLRVRSVGFTVMGILTLAGVFGLGAGKARSPPPAPAAVEPPGVAKSENPPLDPETLKVALVVAGLFLLCIGIYQAIATQRKERDKGVAAQRQALDAYIRAEVQRMLERHRGKLERFVQARIEDWEAAIDAHHAAHVLPRLERDSAEHVESLRELKLRATAVNDELSKARSQRATLQSAWVELQSQARDLGVGQ